MKTTSRDDAPRPADPRRTMRFARTADDVLVAGVAGGLGERWGVDAIVVRIAFVVLAFCGGVGVFLYLGAWAVADDPGAGHDARETTTRQAGAFALVVTGIVFILRDVGLWFGDQIGIPLALAAAGAGLIYVRSDPVVRQRWRFGPRGETSLEKPSLLRVLLGGVLVVGGTATLLAQSEGFIGIATVVFAVLVTAAGLGVAFGPWIWRLWAQLADERRDRIRSEERAEVAAHLHDSVLQTLALIQRHQHDPRRMVSLARRQERELREWLYGAPALDGERVGAAVTAVAAEVEEAHDVPVDVVVVGDRELDDAMRALVGACREAATNAARHSGAGAVSIYVECEPGAVTAFVRDRGRGFDPLGVPDDRRGIVHSIRGRVERHGGTVRITTAHGEGTEVQMQIPVDDR